MSPTTSAAAAVVVVNDQIPLDLEAGSIRSSNSIFPYNDGTSSAAVSIISFNGDSSTDLIIKDHHNHHHHNNNNNNSQYDRPSEKSNSFLLLSTTSPHPSLLSASRSYLLITLLSSLLFLSSFTNGILTVGLPSIASELGLDENLIIWPISILYLTCAACFMLAGALSDALGAKKICLTGSFALGIFMLACGLAKTGTQMIAFRALQGVGWAMVGPASVAIIGGNVQKGRRRNLGFAGLGLAQPLGFSVGLVIGGLLVQKGVWRVGFYVGGAGIFGLFLGGLWVLPGDRVDEGEASMGKRLREGIDWVGAMLASAVLAMLSYALATISVNLDNIKEAKVIVLLSLSVALVPAFIAWMHWQEKNRRPALIPNHVWTRWAFTSVCVMIMLAHAIANGMELFCVLFFEKVQGLSALDASLRILPSLIVGVMLNFSTGLLINRVPVLLTVIVATGLCAGGPLLMALINPQSPYWYNAFFAQLLAPFAIDVLFTIGLIVVSDSFPDQMQGVAAGVFNTFAQLGSSIGLTIMSVISISVTQNSNYEVKTTPDAILVGYRACFWTMFAWMVAACLVGTVGLRNLGRIGERKD